MKPGRLCIKLAKLLQHSFPEHNGLALTWKPEWLYPATGSYRTDYRLDCWRWEGFGKHVRKDGSSFAVLNVGGYETMTNLCKAKKLRLSDDGEVYPA